MAVVFDATPAAPTAATAATTLNFDITLGAAANRAVMVGVSTNTNTLGMVADIGGVNLPIIAGTDNGTLKTILLGAATTLTGLQTVTVSWTTVQDVLISAVSASGVDQTTPINNGTKTSSAASPLSLAVTSVAGDLTMTVEVDTLATSAAPTTNQTVRWAAAAWDTLVVTDGGGDTGPGTANPTHTWTNAGATAMAISGANFVQAAAGGAAFIFPKLLMLLGLGN